MMNRFVILRKGKKEVYDDYDAIPSDLDHIIEFLPHMPPPPHTHEQHEEIDQWGSKLSRLLEIERANAIKRSGSTS